MGREAGAIDTRSIYQVMEYEIFRSILVLVTAGVAWWLLAHNSPEQRDRDKIHRILRRHDEKEELKHRIKLARKNPDTLGRRWGDIMVQTGEAIKRKRKKP